MDHYWHTTVTVKKIYIYVLVQFQMQCHLWKSVFLQSLYIVKSLVFSTNRPSAGMFHAYRTYRKPMLAFCRSLHNIMSSCMHVCFFRLCLRASCSSSTEWACLLSSLVSLLLLSLITHLSESFRMSKPFSLYKNFLSNV